jgi:hypothetical protein
MLQRRAGFIKETLPFLFCSPWGVELAFTGEHLDMKILAFQLILLLMAAFSAQPPNGSQSSAPQRTRVDVAKLGPKVGERVPDFNLPDQTGRMRTLQSIMGPKGAMLVFFRSADW